MTQPYGLSFRPRRGAPGPLTCAVLITALAVSLAGRAAAAQGPATKPAATTRQAGPTTTTSRPHTAGPILLNFKDASLQTVLEYLSETAGLVILEGGRVDGRVTVMSRQPISTDEAVALLDTVLREKGHAAIRNGRMLKIVPIEQAVRESLPVHTGGDPDDVPNADRLVTQVIPIRYANATKLKTDLAPLVGTGATLAANEASNSLILVDAQANIRRIMQIIRALDDHMAGEAEVKIYRLQYADAANTSRLLTDLFKQDQSQQEVQLPFGRFRFGRGGRGGRGGNQDEQKGGRQQKVVAAADERTNTLVVSAPPDLLQVIDDIIKELDSDPSEEQTVFVYPLKNAQAANLQTVLNEIFSETTTTTGARGATGQSAGARDRGRFRGSSRDPAPATAAGAGDLVGQVYVVADEDTNSLLVRTATKHLERVKDIVAELDRPIRQVLIKVLIAEVTHDDTFDLGAEFSILNLRLGASASYDVPLGPVGESGGLLTATMDAGLATTINALQRDGRLEVLSRPYILASENKEAIITVGQEVPFIRNSRTTETGQTINTIEYEDVGIILTVTPHVNPDGLVIIDVSPEISTVTDTTVPISETVNATVYAKRSARTQVAIHTGRTIVIGGLMEDRVIESVRKVPGLGDIPLLGALFRRTVRSKVKTELLIFLTPHVAERAEDLQSATIEGTPQGDAFDEHLKAMRSGATTRPARSQREVRP